MKKSKVALIITYKGDIFSSLKGTGYIFDKNIFFFHIGELEKRIKELTGR